MHTSLQPVIVSHHCKGHACLTPPSEAPRHSPPPMQRLVVSSQLVPVGHTHLFWAALYLPPGEQQALPSTNTLGALHMHLEPSQAALRVPQGTTRSPTDSSVISEKRHHQKQALHLVTFGMCVLAVTIFALAE
jgi:hypothetical protein